MMSGRALGLAKLRLTAIGTLALLIGVSTLFFALILSYVGVGLIGLVVFVVIFNFIQWLLAPKLINAMYRVREVKPSDNPKLYGMVERLSGRVGIEMPKVMLANIPIPNAFAYGSPLTGRMVAVTSGLMKELEEEEVEAVLGHELGHLRNRDVQIMMFASVLPAIFYFIGFSLMLSGMYGGYRRNGGGAVLIGMAAMAIYWILTLLVLGLSRSREYYADRRSVMAVDDGARKLSEALAKIVASGSRVKHSRSEQGAMKRNAFKALFIEDPDRPFTAEYARARHDDQRLVQEIASRKLSRGDRLLELFSTHPNIVKRLRALQALA